MAGMVMKGMEGWLRGELKDWLENIVWAYKSTGDAVAISPKVVARLILLELKRRGVEIEEWYE